MALKRIAVIALTLILLHASIKPAFADVAPPSYPPGSSISPESQTKVRMLEEHVFMDFDPGDLHDPEAKSYSAYRVYVKADFSMQNTGSSSESMQVRFPLSYKYPSEDLLINDFQVWVEGRPIAFEKKTYPNDQFSGNMKLWAEFPVTFFPKQEILIQVKYSIRSIVNFGHDSVSYIFETGAGWYGTIGKAELIVNLPYGYSPESILSVLPGGTIFGKSIRWTWQEFEPTAKDNFYITIENPVIWKEVVLAKQAILDNPKDGSAYTRLGTLYAWMAAGKRYIAYPNYKELAIAALKKGAELSPEDPEPHYQLYDLYSLDIFMQMVTSEQISYQACFPIIDELNQILMRNGPSTPQDYSPEQIQKIYDGIKCPNKPALTSLRGSFPTSTPTAFRSPTVDPYAPTATDLPTSTPKPTSTNLPSHTPTYTPSPANTYTTTPTLTVSPTLIVPKAESSNSILWIVGIVVAVSLLAGGIYYSKRR